MEVDWGIVAGDLVTQVLRIMVPVLIALILKWGSELILKIREEQPKLYWMLSEAAEIGYAVAEEYYRDQKVNGKEKLEKAISHAMGYLESFGLKVDEDVVKDAIINYGTTHELFSWTQEQRMKDGTTE